jgi:glycosyltransferase involved in cell wall biosynthesis
MPILEAQSVGRPVITSNILSMPEVGGGAALYVDPLNIDEISSAIQKVKDDSVLREKLKLKGFDNVKRFNADYIANQYEALYKDILDKN